MSRDLTSEPPPMRTISLPPKLVRKSSSPLPSTCHITSVLWHRHNALRCHHSMRKMREAWSSICSCARSRRVSCLPEGTPPPPVAYISEMNIAAGRYKIESQRIQGKPQCRYAINEQTGQRVFLKFFRRGSAEFANAVKIHRAVESDSKFVSKCVC